VDITHAKIFSEKIFANEKFLWEFFNWKYVLIKTNSEPSMVAKFFVHALKTGKVVPNLLT